MTRSITKTPCMKCDKQTNSIRKGRANYECEECGNRKSLSDFYYLEAKRRNEI